MVYYPDHDTTASSRRETLQRGAGMSANVNFLVGGEAGQGVQSVGNLLTRSLARGGLRVFADQDYESRVRGGHSFFRVRAGTAGTDAISESIDVLIALNAETMELHRGEVSGSGIIIHDGEQFTAAEGEGELLSVPLRRLAVETGGAAVMANSVALGAGLGVVGYDLAPVEGALRDRFEAGEVAEGNVRAVRAGHEYARQHMRGDGPARLQPAGGARLMLNGNEAISLGAIAAGCRFMSSYPMTPATSIMEYLAGKSDQVGLAVVQTEDEIAAINMAVGAGFAGVRAMTATSGSGFCLMVEGLGLAGITETPVVIVDAQRPGPAVGMPTRTEQGDLEFVLHAHHGEFPRAVLAPTTVADAFWVTVKAFNLAEKYQVPVIILTDHHLASSYATVDEFDLSQVTIERGPVFGDEEDPAAYRRHRITHDGISPRAFPGLSDALVITDSDEHDEAGHMTESAEVRTAQVQKRLRKAFSLKQDISPPPLYGPKAAETTLIGWGSTYGAIREAVETLHREKVSINMVHLSEIWPFPGEAVADAMARSRSTYVVENNATGQLSRLIRRETGREVTGRILKYDGRPFTPDDIIRRLEKEGCAL